jgi:zinc protease
MKARFLKVVLCLALVAAPVSAQHLPARRGVTAQKPRPAAPARFFPYEIHHKTFANGLNVIIIPAPEFKDQVTYATSVFAGSGKETQKGKTGLAHLFEHIMFLHEYGGKPEGYEDAIKRLGADNNASTDYDLTFYHPFTFTSNLVGPVQTPEGPTPGIIELEASRFKNLKIDRKSFQVEAGAVQGEYRRIFSFPTEKLIEEMSPVAFPNHPYGHTVIGYREDVENMPNAWDAAWEFFRNYYNPASLAIVVVGDVNPQKLFPVIEKAYADWKPVPPPKTPAPIYPPNEPPVHVNWEADVAPHIMIAYHTPAEDPATADAAMALVLNELLTSRSAPLFQKLRYRKQTVTNFSTYATPDSTAPHWFVLDSELSLDRFKQEGDKYINDVQGDIINGVDELKNFSRQPNAARTLEVIKSKVKNDFLAQLNTTENISYIYSWFFRFNRNPNVLEVLMQSVMALTPTDVDTYARTYLKHEGRIIGTLWHGEAPKSEKSGEVRW